MYKYSKIIDKCEKNGVPYRGRNDDIKGIVSNLCQRMSAGDEDGVKAVIDVYKSYSYIYDIRVDRNKCIIDYDEGTIHFSTISKEISDAYHIDSLGISKLSGNCHYVVEKVLELWGYDNISAVTSLCININNMFYFHSYIHDRNIDMVLDFSKNLMMDKDDYDNLFCQYEFNDLNYDEYMEKLDSSNYNAKKDNIYPLLYLACHELEENNIDINDVLYDKISMKR